jgi:hypothetical protein
VCIKAGHLDTRRDLFLSPNHRVLLRSTMAELWFGHPEVLVPAKALVNGTTVQRVPMAKADYLHILLDNHDLVFSEGIATESLFTGAVAQGALDTDALDELHAIFPVFDQPAQQLSRLGLTMTEARFLIQSDWGEHVRAVRHRAA